MRESKVVVKRKKKKDRTGTHIAEMLSAPLSRDGISDICGHMIREDFYYKIIPQPPSLCHLARLTPQQGKFWVKQLTTTHSKP